MSAKQNRGGAAVILLVFAVVLATGLILYMEHAGKLDLSFLRKWQVEAMNLFKQSSGEPDQKLEKVLTVNLDDLSGTLNENQVVERYRGTELSCFSIRDPLGEYSCSASVALFNDIPARRAAFFFVRDRLTSLRVTFPVERLAEINTQLEKKFGAKADIGLRDPHTERPLRGWKLAGGTLGVNDFIQGERDAILLWLATGAKPAKR